MDALLVSCSLACGQFCDYPLHGEGCRCRLFKKLFVAPRSVSHRAVFFQVSSCNVNFVQDDNTTHGIVPAAVAMLPLSSDAALDAMIDAIIMSALDAPALLGEFAKTCSDLAEIDRSECFVAVTYKGWYFDSTGLGDRWDGPHAGAVAARAAAQRHVSFVRRLVASCKSACDAALRSPRPPAGDAERAGNLTALFSFVAHLSREGILPRCVPLAYAAQLLGAGDAAIAHSDFEGRVDAACAMTVRGHVRG